MIIYFIPIISALIGWFTNFIAVKMLFNPKEPVNLGFYTLQGIFPKRQKMVAEKIGKMVAEELFSLQDIKERIKDPENLKAINEQVEKKLETYLTTTFPEKFPLMAFFVGDGTREKLKSEFIAEIDSLAPEVIERLIVQMESSIDVEKIIRDKVSTLSADKLEALIMDVLKKEFQFIEWIGAAIGLIIGLLQVFLIRFQ